MSLVIFSVIMGSLFSVWRMGVSIERRAEQSTGTVGETAAFFEAFSRDLENARGYDLSTSYPQISSFDGKDQQLLFLTVRGGRLVVVRYTLVPFSGTSGMEGVRQVARFEAPFEKYMESSKALEEPTRIFRAPFRVDGFAFGYQADSKSNEALSVWKKERPPAVVLLRCSVARPGDPLWTVERHVLIPAGGA